MRMMLAIFGCCCVSVKAQLSGTYTIDPQQPPSATNFQGLVTAVDSLKAQGVSATVTFNMAPGIYAGPVVITPIAGASATNTITFRSAHQHADSVTITSAVAAQPVVQFSGAMHVTFRHVSVISPPSSGSAFMLSGNASHISILNNNIVSATEGVSATGFTGIHNIFSDNVITAGRGISISGSSVLATADSITISGNMIAAPSGSGLWLEHAASVHIARNTLSAADTAIAVYNSHAVMVVNNSIISGTGICNYRGTDQHFYHNSINATHAGMIVSYNNASNGNEWMNNIIAAGAGGNALSFQNSGSANVLDYNLYYTAGTIRLNGYDSIEAWIAASGQDSNSVHAAPGFISHTDLRLDNGCRPGIFIPSVPEDINHVLRSNPPSLGAYEYRVANNVMVERILQPVQSGSLIRGLQDLSVRVRNAGTQPLTLFNISYVLNNDLPVTHLWSGFLLPCDTVTITFSGVSQVNLGAKNHITVYTDSPNGLIDSVPVNDTLRTLIYTPLSGTYTIGNAGADFQSFNEAVNMLNAIGVAGPVVFDVQSGIYSGPVVFPGAVNGASSSNTILFQSSDAHADSVIIRHTATSAANNYVINLNTASFITFRHISLEALSNAYYTAFTFSGSASYNSLQGCKLAAVVPANISGNNNNTEGLVFAAGVTGAGNTFIRNSFTGGMNGVFIEGASTSSMSRNTVIDSNIFLNTYHSSVHLKFPRNASISHNTIRTVSAVFTYTAIDVANSDSLLDIVANNIYGEIETGLAISTMNCNGLHNRPILIANNSVSLKGKTDIYAISFMEGSYHDFFHNTVNVLITTPTGGGFGLQLAAMTTPGPGFRIKNNIISARGGIGASVIFYVYNPLNVETDYNNLYTSGEVLVVVPFPSSAIYGNLDAWQAGSGADLNSVSVEPLFADSADLRLPTSCIKGTGLPEVTTDINGATRAAPPLIGAYETSVPSEDVISLLSLLQPVAPFTAGTQDIKVRIQNTGETNLTAFDITYRLNADPPVTLQSTGLLPVCAIDTFTFTGVTFPATSDLVVYASEPADSIRANDTLRVNLRSALNGMYTIGGTSPSFTDFTAAFQALHELGISGPVTFDVAAGTTYTQNPLRLETIPGNGRHSIVFRKSGAGANPVIFGTGGTGGSDAVITLATTDSVTFDGINVQDNAGNTNNTTRMEYGYHLTAVSFSGSSRNTIKNCKVVLNRANTGSIGIYQSKMNNHINRYENVVIENCYQGIVLAGDGGVPDSNCVITSSGTDTTFIGGTAANDIGNGSGTSSGIRLVSQKNVEVSNCVVRNVTITGTSAVHGIYLDNTAAASAGNAIISNNRIYNIRTTSTSTSSTGGVHGIRVEVSQASAATVFNNVVHSLFKANPGSPNASILLRGITHNSSSSGQGSYYNNSVSVTSGASANVSSTAFMRAGGIATLRNNILINTTGAQTGQAKHYAIYYNSLLINSSSNLLWSANTNGHIGYLSGDRTTLSDWRVATGQDMNSLTYLPRLLPDNHLEPDPADTASWAMNGRGTHLDFIPSNTDLAGNVRPATLADGVPDIGAYEFTPVALPPLARAVPAAIDPFQAVDTVQVFMFGLDTVARIKWSAGSNIQPVSVRQYSGERPPAVSPNQNYMYFYTGIETTGSGFIYDVDVYYRSNWTGTNPNLRDIRLARKETSQPWLLVNASSIDTFRNVITGQFLTTFSLFSGTDLNNPMPVSLLDFNGLRVNRDVILAWTTANEINNKGFEIERSANGRSFEKIGFVQGRGNSKAATTYRFNDQDAFGSENSDRRFYRLKQVDRNGRYEYSDVILIRKEESKLREAIIYPNPNHTGVLHFTEEVAVVVYDVQGRQVKFSPKTSRLDISGLGKGLYFVHIAGAAVQKLLVE